MRITSGNFALGANDVTQGGIYDLAVMDDFVYGEPVAFTAVLTISPPSGTFTVRQSIDLTLIVTAGARTHHRGEHHPRRGQRGCRAGELCHLRQPGVERPEVPLPGRAPRQPRAWHPHPDAHLTFDDGSAAKDKAVYVVNSATEP